MRKLKQACYRNSLLLLLGVTRALSRADMQPPTKWVSFLDSLRASSGMLHTKISQVDEEVGQEFIEKEEIVDKRLGKKKFYDPEELKILKNNRENIKL